MSDFFSIFFEKFEKFKKPEKKDKYTDDKFEYRHVHVPREWVKQMPKDRTMTEQEWRDLGDFLFQVQEKLETLKFLENVDR